LGSQRISEFGLHARAILGLPVGEVELIQPACSVALLGEGNGIPRFEGVDKVLATPTTQIRLFGKPVCEGKRRLAVVITNADKVDLARVLAKEAAEQLTIHIDPLTSSDK
jgi:phosphoribosylglycinamide formyltransferase 2